MLRTALALSTFVLIGCTENDLNPWDGVGGTAARIEVDPPTLDFGVLRQGESAVKEFTITNIGEGELEVQAVRVDDALASFQQVDDLNHFFLPPGASEVVTVRFEPRASHEQTGAGLVLSNDPDTEVAEVELLGFGAVPELAIDPENYDFGTHFVGCPDDREVTLANVGTDDLVITDVSYSDGSGQLTLDAALSLPLTLAPGQDVPMFVDFHATDEATATGYLTVTSNDPRGVVTAVQTADAQFAAWIEDTFTVPVDPPVDIVFAVDQSCSMDGHSAQLGSSFSTLISAIQTVTSGWKIGVATLDTGCFNGGALTVATPSLLSTFASAVSHSPNGDPSLTEKLFALTQVALSKTLPGQCNAGFLRPDALLHVVLVSDEWEQSGITPGQFAYNVAAYKGGVQSLVKVSGIICPPSGCGIADGSDTGYATAVALTGGVRGDVMSSDWSQLAQDLATASLAQINHYPLSNNAAGASIEVYVNGQAWPSGWHYDAGTNELVFDVTPPEGATLEVGYGALVNCPP